MWHCHVEVVPNIKKIASNWLLFDTQWYYLNLNLILLYMTCLLSLVKQNMLVKKEMDDLSLSCKTDSDIYAVWIINPVNLGSFASKL